MFPRTFLSAVFFFAIALPVFAAETKDETFIDPENAGPDFKIQGEYKGSESAAQVIALGDGKFHIVGWSKGLPGTVEDAERKIEVDAHRDGEKVVFEGSGWKGSIMSGQMRGTSDENGQTVELSRIERKSSTEGAKPPEGAVVLFDGTNADAWNGGKMDDRKLLYCGVKSKQTFGDCTIHVEFITPFKPTARGQGRGNSGVYVQDRYECQVLDSFGLKGEDNEMGGIYHTSKPRLNMCFPPLTWQTYDIDFEAARYDAEGKKTKDAVITLKLNGVLVQDHVSVPKPTPGGAAETPAPGPIQLQGHGNPVFFRNIWVVERK